jgi:hypothetical protein
LGKLYGLDEKILGTFGGFPSVSISSNGIYGSLPQQKKSFAPRIFSNQGEIHGSATRWLGRAKVKLKIVVGK